MKRELAAVVFVLVLASGAVAAAKGPEIDLVNNKLSINAEAVSLGRLLHLLDLATGMQSKVPPELANRNISVKFSDLTLEDGVRKIFQGQPFDYVVIAGQAVIVTSASQALAGAESTPIYNSSQSQPIAPQPFQQPFEQPFVQDFPPVGGVVQPGQQPQQQPAMIQTPFGPIANPRAGQPSPQIVPVPGPGQQSLFPDQRLNQQQGAPGFPGTSPVSPTPFGAPSPFGTPQSNPNNLNSPFGAPTVFGAPGATQPRQ